MIKVINEHFIPVAENDWYQRRRQDAVGDFFREVADQGPRKGEGGATRQGHYALTAGGVLLGYNNNRGAQRHLEMVKAALAKWEALPEDQRKAGGLTVGKLPSEKLDKKFAQEMPDGVVVLRTSSRLLKETDGVFQAISKEENPHGWGHQAAHNQMWLQAEEIAQLRGITSGKPVDLPKRIAYRLMRYHLLDNTRGEPNYWSREDVDDYRFTVRVPEGRSNRRVVEGRALLSHGENLGFEVRVLGYLDIDPAADKLTDVQIVALGDHWGGGKFTGGARPGRNPVGIAFSLADIENDPAAQVPPQGSHWLDGYWRADQH